MIWRALCIHQGCCMLSGCQVAETVTVGVNVFIIKRIESPNKSKLQNKDQNLKTGMGLGDV